MTEDDPGETAAAANGRGNGMNPGCTQGTDRGTGLHRNAAHRAAWWQKGIQQAQDGLEGPHPGQVTA